MMGTQARFLAMAMACGLSGAGLWAQSSASNSGLAGTKVAAINMRAAIANTAEGKRAAAKLETEFTAKRNELEDVNKQITDIQQRLDSSGDVLSADEKERLTIEGQRLSRQLQRKQNEYQEDLTDAQNDVISRIEQRMMEVVRTYAPSKGYRAVLDDSSQTTPVIYASTDITEDIVKLYDHTYPVKSASATGDPKSADRTASKTSGKTTGQTGAKRSGQ
ncbi:MAG: OmpH family outer membrane protein [Candidatus Acidiferrum sp.]